MTEELKQKIVWQNINASKDKSKVLTGKIVALETEKMNNEEINCAIVDFKGIKILIPAIEISQERKNDKRLLRNMMGAEIKFIVVEFDRVTEKAVGSRIRAMDIIKNINFNKCEVGDKVYAKVVGIWKKYIRVECLGADFIIKAKDLQFGYIDDVSKIYKVNDNVKVLIKEIDKATKEIKISIKDLLVDPFKDIRKDFIEKGEYLATITGYTDNGIFANIAQGVDTICTLPQWLDIPPMPGDKVIIKIYKILPERRKIYSSLVKIVRSGLSE